MSTPGRSIGLTPQRQGAGCPMPTPGHNAIDALHTLQ
jgi:hypothetical protein